MSSSIHSLCGIIEQLELRVSNFKVPNPTDKQKASVEAQVVLIQQLQSIYDEYSRFTMWELFSDIQTEHDRMIALDSELEGLIIKIPFKHDAVKYGFINFTL